MPKFLNIWEFFCHYQRKKTLQIFKDLEAFQIFKLQTFILEDFLSRKIDGEELCGRVYGLRRKLINACEKFTVNILLMIIKLIILSFIFSTYFRLDFGCLLRITNPLHGPYNPLSEDISISDLE